MKWMGRIREAFEALFRRGRMEDDLDEELRFHIEREAEEYIRGGMEPEAARREARRRFGGVERTKEQVRDETGVRLLVDLGQDLRYGLRRLAHDPGYAAVIVVTLALGIGANTAIFSVIDGVLLDPLPYASGNDLVYLEQRAGAEPMSFSVKDIEDLRAASRSLDEVVEHHGMTFTLRGLGEPELVETGVVSHNFFSTLGVEPLLGRDFADPDDDPGAEPVLLLSHGYWERRFGGDPSVVGRAFEMNGMMHTVIGVLPPVPQYPRENDVYMTTSACPIRSSEGFIENRSARMMDVFGRGQDGVTVEAVNADLEVVLAGLAREHPEAYRTEQGQRLVAASLKEELVHNARPTLLMLLGTAGFVLLIACANVANLALARMTRREQEMAVRTAMGAGRGRLVRQLVTESVILGLAGGLLGLGVAVGGLDLLVSFAGRFTSRAAETSIDASVLVFTLAASVATGLAFGVFPALQARQDPSSTLREGGGASLDRRRGRMQSGLVMTQVALSFVLLVGAGLMTKSFLAAQAVDPGYDREGVLTMRVTANTRNTDMSMPEMKAFYLELEERIRTHPAVRAAAVTNSVPAAGNGFPFGVRTEANVGVEIGDLPKAELRTASPHFLEAAGVRLERGRFFTEADDSSAAQVVVINASLADRLWPASDAVGNLLGVCRVQTDSCSGQARVVGVIADVRQAGADQEPPNQIYQPSAQASMTGQDFLIRTTGDPRDVAQELKTLVHAVNPTVPISSISTLEEVWDESLAPRRLTTILLGLFAVVALLVSLAGIAGVVAFAVSQRTREIGIRMALGADRTGVLAVVLRRGLGLVAGGVVVGVVLALWTARLLEGLLWGVATTDLVTWSAVAVVLLAVSALACWIPARRATRIDPVVAFRGG